LLRYVRTQRVLPLAIAMLASSAGILWALDTGVFAFAGTVAIAVAMRASGLTRISWRKLVAVIVAAVVVPVAILLVARADLRNFVIDSFVTMPSVSWIVWSLPQPDPPHENDFLFWLADDPARYYVPLVVYGLALAVAVRRWRRGDREEAARIASVVLFALLLFRAAAGRVDANHIRFALPLFGIAAVACVVEPAAMRGRAFVTIVAAVFFLVVCDVVPNVTTTFDTLRTWPARHAPDGLVAVPLRAAGGMYERPEVAADLEALNAYVTSLGPQATILDVANDRALYYLLERKSPARYLDVMMWSSPPILADEMRRLRANPPACVIVQGYANDAFDGIGLRTRVPQLAAWVDANYPRRLRFGRFVVAAR
ncbi:MAG TPA: hypothetical protein VLU46_08765, partial [Thermoanaerobaculia bacterium]|nr:hypothetical protein [Thermoanaerobaculia bacterium]